MGRIINEALKINQISMEKIGLWIILTFILYYIVSLMSGSKHTIGSLLLGGVLAAGIVLII